MGAPQLLPRPVHCPTSPLSSPSTYRQDFCLPAVDKDAALSYPVLSSPVLPCSVLSSPRVDRWRGGRVEGRSGGTTIIRLMSPRGPGLDAYLTDPATVFLLLTRLLVMLLLVSMETAPCRLKHVTAPSLSQDRLAKLLACWSLAQVCSAGKSQAFELATLLFSVLEKQK